MIMLWRYNDTDTRDVVEAGRRTHRYIEEQNTTQQRTRLPERNKPTLGARNIFEEIGADVET